MGVLVRELTALYELLAKGAVAVAAAGASVCGFLPAGSGSGLQGEVLEKQLNYWRKQLSGCRGSARTSYRPARPKIQRFHGETRHFTIPETVSKRIENFLSETRCDFIHAAAGGVEGFAAAPMPCRTTLWWARTWQIGNCVETEEMVGFSINHSCCARTCGGSQFW